mgnify:CR=1 FL=1
MIIGKKIKNICKKNKVKFIINDDPLLALKLDADGCHLGQKDMNIKTAKKILGKKIGTNYLLYNRKPWFWNTGHICFCLLCWTMTVTGKRPSKIFCGQN